MTGRCLIAHGGAAPDGYATVEVVPDDGHVTCAGLPFTLDVADVLPPR